MDKTSCFLISLKELHNKQDIETLKMKIKKLQQANDSYFLS